MKRNARMANAFFGDSGSMLPEQARDEIEQNAGAGHKGNDVDFSQRYAQSEADEYTEQAERMTRNMERSNGFKYSGQFADPDKRREFVEGLARALKGEPDPPKPGQREEQEEPFLSREADEKFWASDEPKKQMPKRL